MPKSPREQRQILEAFDKVRAANDRLGAYSDHEGNADGSTCFFWRKGADAFAEQIARAIADHEAAIRAWRDLAYLNLKCRTRKVGSDV